MFNIRDIRDLNFAYLLLGAYEECGNAEKIVEIKREIRQYAHKKQSERIIKEYGIDGFISLLELPDSLETREEAEEYFEKKHFIPSYPSIYDCTGKAFTSWFKLFRRHDRFVVYHRVAFDV